MGGVGLCKRHLTVLLLMAVTVGQAQSVWACASMVGPAHADLPCPAAGQVVPGTAGHPAPMPAHRQPCPMTGMAGWLPAPVVQALQPQPQRVLQTGSPLFVWTVADVRMHPTPWPQGPPSIAATHAGRLVYLTTLRLRI